MGKHGGREIFAAVLPLTTRDRVNNTLLEEGRGPRDRWREAWGGSDYSCHKPRVTVTGREQGDHFGGWAMACVVDF